MAKRTASGAQMMTACTIQLGDGSFCDSPMHPDAPFPICPAHARIAYVFGTSLVAGARNGLQHLPADSFPLAPPTLRKKNAQPGVYFLELGGLVKVGASENVPKRLNSYPPVRKVLYVYSTDDPWRLEQQILKRFSHIRKVGNEWFEPAPELFDFIESLKAAA